MTDMQNCGRTSAFQVGEIFTRAVTFGKEAIVQFATLAGDFNPLHHDEAFAKATQFNGLIASGTQTCALMLGALATLISERTVAVGLGFSLKMKKAIHAGENATIVWEVVAIEPKPSLKGDIVTFAGKLLNQHGEPAITAECANLIFLEAVNLSADG